MLITILCYANTVTVSSYFPPFTELREAVVSLMS